MSPAPSSDRLSDFEVVTVTGISRFYGRRRALSKVSLECRTGTMTGLFGPNGAGKSTLLGILSTVIQPSQGVVRYGKRPADEWGDVLRARVGVLGHDLFLYGDLTARENLEFFGRLHGITRITARTDEALSAARLTDRAGDRVAAFSRGLRQRLALERALIHDPRLVLLDEPFTGLDDASTGLLTERLRALRTSGAIIVMATHDFDTADGQVDQAGCLENGRLAPIAAGEGRLRERYRRALDEGLPR
jgi:ABC-type multidrug transport system ATPase subunit